MRRVYLCGFMVSLFLLFIQEVGMSMPGGMQFTKAVIFKIYQKDVDGLKELFRSNPDIKMLELYNFDLDYHVTEMGFLDGYDYDRINDEDVAVLAQALPGSSINRLVLRNNNIGPKGIRSIADVLPRTLISELDLGANNIGVDGAMALAEVLPETKISCLILSYCELGADGVLAIIEALCNTKHQIDLLEIADNLQPVDYIMGLAGDFMAVANALSKARNIGCVVGSGQRKKEMKYLYWAAAFNPMLEVRRVNYEAYYSRKGQDKGLSWHKPKGEVGLFRSSLEKEIFFRKSTLKKLLAYKQRALDEEKIRVLGLGTHPLTGEGSSLEMRQMKGLDQYLLKDISRYLCVLNDIRGFLKDIVMCGPNKEDIAREFASRFGVEVGSEQFEDLMKDIRDVFERTKKIAEMTHCVEEFDAIRRTGLTRDIALELGIKEGSEQFDALEEIIRQVFETTSGVSEEIKKMEVLSAIKRAGLVGAASSSAWPNATIPETAPSAAPPAAAPPAAAPPAAAPPAAVLFRR